MCSTSVRRGYVDGKDFIGRVQGPGPTAAVHSVDGRRRPRAGCVRRRGVRRHVDVLVLRRALPLGAGRRDRRYDRGSHNMVSCMSCHEPVNADPITFTYYKAKAGIVGAYQLCTKTNETPLNAASQLALEPEADGFRAVHPVPLGEPRDHPEQGDHHRPRRARGERDPLHRVSQPCRASRERAVRDRSTRTPTTARSAPKHANFMSMTACFRCHTLTSEVRPRAASRHRARAPRATRPTSSSSRRTTTPRTSIPRVTPSSPRRRSTASTGKPDLRPRAGVRRDDRVRGRPRTRRGRG